MVIIIMIIWRWKNCRSDKFCNNSLWVTGEAEVVTAKLNELRYEFLVSMEEHGSGEKWFVKSENAEKKASFEVLDQLDFYLFSELNV